MTLAELGYTDFFETHRSRMNLQEFEIARVSAMFKDRYVIKTETAEYDAEILGIIRFNATSKADFPAVGDWVAVQIIDDDNAVIHSVLPRKTVLQRQTAAKNTDIQVIAANVDVAFIMQAIDRDFNLARLERYLTVVNTAKVQPVVILNKIDLLDEETLHDIVNQIKSRINPPVLIPYSNVSGIGFDEVSSLLSPAKTYCFIGSSGVGKSTLINKLAGKELMKTGSISDLSNRGRHVTSHRELLILDNGSIVIDNPGMREIGLTDATEGLQKVFDQIMELSKDCWFSDCSHTHEKKCAVKEAVENGDIDEDAFNNYLKMETEKRIFESSVDARRKKDKSLSKIIKNYKKQQNKK